MLYPLQISACHRVECSADRKSYTVFVAVGYDGVSTDVRPIGSCKFDDGSMASAQSSSHA